MQASANFDENSPNTRCSLRRSTSPNVATSQNTVVPPLPSTISQPSGRREQVGQPARTAPTSCFTGAWRCDVPTTVRPAASDGVELLGADLRRPAAEAPVGREQVGGHAQRRRGRVSVTVPAWQPCRSSESVTCLVSARPASPPSPNRPRSPSTPRPRRCRPQGEAVIGFGAGEPDFPTPEHIVEAAVGGLPRPEEPPLHAGRRPARAREAIAVKTKRDSGFDCSASQVLVTNGGKHAVFTAFAALCDPGDEVICPAPYWTTYPEAITLAGGVPTVIDTTEETGFQVTVDQLEQAYTTRTKVLLFVSPDNPSGAVYSPEQVAAIGQWAVERGVWVVTDEIYEHLTYGPHEFTSMPTVVPDLAEQCVDRQRRRQDVRHDRVARRLDDRPDRT